MKSFSDRLGWAVRSSGKNKTALAEYLGVPQSSVSRWFTGPVPRAETLGAIAKFLRVPVDWLATGEIEAAEWAAMVEERMRFLDAPIADALAEVQAKANEEWKRSLSASSMLREEPAAYGATPKREAEPKKPTLDDAMALLRPAMRIIEEIQQNQRK